MMAELGAQGGRSSSRSKNLGPRTRLTVPYTGTKIVPLLRACMTEQVPNPRLSVVRLLEPNTRLAPF